MKHVLTVLLALVFTLCPMMVYADAEETNDPVQETVTEEIVEEVPDEVADDVEEVISETPEESKEDSETPEVIEDEPVVENEPMVEDTVETVVETPVETPVEKSAIDKAAERFAAMLASGEKSVSVADLGIPESDETNLSFALSKYTDKMTFVIDGGIITDIYLDEEDIEEDSAPISANKEIAENEENEEIVETRETVEPMVEKIVTEPIEEPAEEDKNLPIGVDILALLWSIKKILVA